MAITVEADVHQYWSSRELADEVNRAVGRGLKAASIFLAARVRELLSVPAPRVRFQDAGGIYYRAGWLIGSKGTVQTYVSPFAKRGVNVNVLRKRRGVEVLERGTFIPSPATAGAPPRKLSGHLRRSVTWEMSPDGTSARIGTNVDYGRKHELGNHKFLLPTLISNASRVAQIIGTSATSGSASVRTS